MIYIEPGSGYNEQLVRMPSVMPDGGHIGRLHLAAFQRTNSNRLRLRLRLRLSNDVAVLHSIVRQFFC